MELLDSIVLNNLLMIGSSITTMFVGGSVAAIEWCPCKGTFESILFEDQWRNGMAWALRNIFRCVFKLEILFQI